METLKLSKPIMINGAEVKELPYDFDSLTGRDKLNAGRKMKADGIPISNIEELDTDYHLYLFAEAVCKADSSIDTTDVMRIGAKESRKGAALARNFFYMSSEE
ncbi:MAG: phage tail assembly protein [Desulfitobacterium sp.]